MGRCYIWICSITLSAYGPAAVATSLILLSKLGHESSEALEVRGLYKLLPRCPHAAPVAVTGWSGIFCHKPARAICEFDAAYAAVTCTNCHERV